MKKPWSKWGFVVTIIGVVLAIIIFFLAPILFDKKPNIEFITISKTRIFKINEDVTGLSIVYKGEDLKLNYKNLTVFTIRIINNGNAPILKNHFDDQLNYGVVVDDGYIVSKPEIINSSDIQYFNKSIEQYNSDTILFKPIIFSPGDYFDVKFLTVHYTTDEPEFRTFGKIANQSEIKISNIDQAIEQKPLIGSKLTAILITVFVTLSIILFYRMTIMYTFTLTNFQTKKDKISEFYDKIKLNDYLRKKLDEFKPEDRSFLSDMLNEEQSSIIKKYLEKLKNDEDI